MFARAIQWILPVAAIALTVLAVAGSVEANHSPTLSGSPASFSAIPAPGSLDATFTVSFVNDRVDWSIDFGDGTTSPVTRSDAGTYTATHSYPGPGTYTARLLTTHYKGNGVDVRHTDNSKTTSVSVDRDPTAAFAATVSGLDLAVDASASSDPDADSLTYAWDFDDGATASGLTASRAYAAAGSYTVRLVVTDAWGRSATTSQTIVANRAPTADGSVSASGLSLAVDGGASTDPDGQALSYTWDWGDGSAAGSGAVASHAYAAAGTYTVRLIVADSLGGSHSRAWSVVANRAPTASFAATPAGLTVAVDAAGSSDPDGGALTYAWDWGDGSPAAAGATASHDYAAGSYTIRLTVTDPLGGVATTTRSVVANRAPVASFTSSVAGRTLTADASASNDPDGGAVTYSWTFGDGAPAGSGTAASHDYAASGRYNVTLTVTDALGGTATRTETILANRAPTSSLTAAAGSVRAGRAVTFTIAVADVDGDTVSWTLDADGDGVVDASGFGGRNVDHTYLQPGSYTARLAVVDPWGAAAPLATAAITVVGDGFPTASLAASATTGTSPFTPTITPTVSDDGSIANWTFDAGDGSPLLRGTGAPPALSPTYETTVDRTLTATLAVWDDAGQRITATLAITVQAPQTANLAPNGWLNLTLPASSRAPRDVAAHVDAFDRDGPTVSWTLDWGDATTPATGSARSADLTHRYSAPGTYTARLTVTDSAGATRVAIVTVAVTPPWTPAIAASAASGLAPLDVAFDLSATDVTGVSGITFDSGLVQLSVSRLPYRVTVRYPAAGEYTAVLEMRDLHGNVERATLRVSVNDAPRAVLLAAPATGTAPLDTAIAWEITDLDAVSWTLDFGDGTSTTGTGKTGSLTHRYAAGSWRAVLTVTDADGAAASAGANVAANAPPTATLRADGVATEAVGDDPYVPTLAWTASSDVVQWTLDYGDGTSATGTGAPPLLAHAYAPGTWTARLTVADAEGATATSLLTVRVNARPTAALTLAGASGAGPHLVHEGDAVTLVWRVVDDAAVAWTIEAAGARLAEGTAATGEVTRTLRPGSHVAWLNVTDARGLRATAFVALTVNDRPALSFYADAAEVGDGPVRASEGEDVALQWTVSDEDAADWTFDLEGKRLAAGSSVAGAWVGELPPGAHVGWLNVTDADGATQSFRVRVEVNGLPVVSLVLAPQNLTGAGSVRFTWSIEDEDSSPRWVLDFGDGTSRNGTRAVDFADHEYAAVGNWTVWLNATDSRGATTSVAATVRVFPPPQLLIDGHPVGEAIAAIGRFDARFVVEVPPNVREWMFEFGDGSKPVVGNETVLSAVLNHTYATHGIYHAKLTVIDSNGNEMVLSSTPIYVNASGATVSDRDALVAAPLRTPSSALEELAGAPLAALGIEQRDAPVASALAGALALAVGLAVRRAPAFLASVRRPKVAPSAAAASGPARCDLCLGAFKGGAPVHACSCGVRLHVSCRARLDACPGCGTTGDVAPAADAPSGNPEGVKYRDASEETP